MIYLVRKNEEEASVTYLFELILASPPFGGDAIIQSYI